MSHFPKTSFVSPEDTYKIYLFRVFFLFFMLLNKSKTFETQGILSLMK